MSTIAEAVEAAENSAPAKVSPRDVLRQLLERNAGAVGASLPTGYSTERFIRLLLTAANTNPELFDCDPRSFLAAGVGAAQLGLEPNDARGLAYLVPFKDRRRGKVVVLIIGYRGMLDLARRSGMVTSINAFPVYRGDAFSFRFGLEPTLDHVPHPDGEENPDHLTYVYAVAKVGGDTQFVVMSRRQIDRVRDQYMRSELSPWKTHYVEMALKTALRRLCKWLPQTVELAAAIEHEDRGLVVGDLAMPGHSLEPGGGDEIIDVELEDEGGDENAQQSSAGDVAAAADSPPIDKTVHEGDGSAESSPATGEADAAPPAEASPDQPKRPRGRKDSAGADVATAPADQPTLEEGS
jgi:recombination protein RecT